MTVLAWVGVACAGGLGALARFGLDGAIASRAARDFPLGTLAVNVTGAFALGLLVGAGVTGDGYLVAGTAAIGSYTTFSTWMLETQRLVEDGETRGALGNVLISLAVGLGAVLLGRALGGAL